MEPPQLAETPPPSPAALSTDGQTLSDLQQAVAVPTPSSAAGSTPDAIKNYIKEHPEDLRSAVSQTQPSVVEATPIPSLQPTANPAPAAGSVAAKPVASSKKLLLVIIIIAIAAAALASAAYLLIKK